MRPPLDGTILVTGASSGIGRELARQLAPRAGALVLVARRTERLEALADELRAKRADLPVHVEPCDLSDAAAVDALLARVEERAGAVDVLVNNAGLGDFGVFDLSDWPKVRAMIDLNVTALVYLTHRLVPAMVARRRGGILNVSSGFGLSFLPGFAAYVGTKHFVTSFTESLRLEVQPEGIVVTQVCPGPVATEFEENAGNFSEMSPPFEISPERCARSALAGFARGRALVVPGIAIRLLLALGAFTPRWMLRLLFAPFARRIRRAQRKSREAATA